MNEKTLWSHRTNERTNKKRRAHDEFGIEEKTEQNKSNQNKTKQFAALTLSFFPLVIIPIIYQLIRCVRISLQSYRSAQFKKAIILNSNVLFYENDTDKLNALSLRVRSKTHSPSGMWMYKFFR